MNDAVLRERVAQGVVLFTLLGLTSWIVRPLLQPVDRGEVVTPWMFYGGLACFAIALVALVAVVYLDETRESRRTDEKEPTDRYASREIEDETVRER
ncbi:hypothetical protein [Halalkalicoccus salilacus]|uniref:hypothetical protein n=1 Tax=Halalkalicoccus TaxID=332246 RepID=UPI002F96170E